MTLPNAGARRIDMVYRRGRHEPGPVAELAAQAIFTSAGRDGWPPAEPATAR
ncbi:MAG: hypothetical protein HKP61_11285 [Dactylosporangium sp.]|nr:hypothetical protein [Dactylosporangium sp.]NNJ61509.1 hypothetical protein [Dactylosporangium sp.]